MNFDFNIIGNISQIEIIIINKSIRDVERLRKTYEQGRWRKLKGIAIIELADNTICEFEYPHFLKLRKRLKLS